MPDELPEGVTLHRDFLAAGDAYLAELLAGIPWKQERIKLFGKSIDVPRLTSWHGDPGTSYRYSGLQLEPEPWTPTLLAIKREIEPPSGVTFNSVLLNLYRHERDSVSWHADDEASLGTQPVIGSVSLGDTRRMQFKHRRDRDRRFEIELSHGSFLLMRGDTQEEWLHQVPKEKQSRGPRVNLTFRRVTRPNS